MRKAPNWAGYGGKAFRSGPITWALLLLVAAGLFNGIFAGSTISRAFAADVPISVGGKAVVSNTDGDPIRIREGAGTNYDQIASAREGQVVNVLDGPVTDSRSITWFKVKAPAATGWMMAQYLKGVAQAAPPPAPTATPAPAPASAPAGNTLTGSARVANTDGDPLRVRSAPNTNGRVISTIAPNTVVAIEAGPVTDEANIVWYKISLADLSGWAMARYLVQVPGGNREAPPQAEPVSQVETPAPTATPRPAPTATPRPANNGSGSSTTSQYRQWMEEARAMYPYPQDTDKMWRVMQCESGGNPNASGGGGRYLGLFQYAPGTWGGSWNPYRNESIWDAKSQIFATAKAWSIGMQNQWSCYYITAGR